MGRPFIIALIWAVTNLTLYALMMFIKKTAGSHDLFVVLRVALFASMIIMLLYALGFYKLEKS